MQIRELFAKSVDRYIEGVIKADDMTSLQLELEEYVVTKEISTHLTHFFEAYNDYQGANGVWISGFYGSGKSHLLKMLALLMENSNVGGQPALDYFLPKVTHDAFLQGALKKSTSFPSRSILFNIDQKADTITTTHTDALLMVFLKVFNETCGYFGKQPYIAQLERDLDDADIFDIFQQAYEEIAGIPWDEGRETIALEKANVDKAYALVSGNGEQSPTNIIDHYRGDYKVSIEDFAELVNTYIEKQPPHFRLNFFVDEVGQFIADNVRLMTNLQTIAESLATRCNGRAWVIVTAQEDMDKVLGEMNQQQAHDFSKIQDRFKIRLKLTSRNVARVIEDRLLEKDVQANSFLSTLYQQQHNNFGTLFDFVEGTSFRNYRNEDDFLRKYPFTAYQFPLFQNAIVNLSKQSAFEGRHSSVGERSMLGVFQGVVKEIASQPIGKLATFDLMFEGIKAALKAQFQHAIINAEEHLEDDFAVRVLKALFLVKYIKGFKATPHNIRILMQETFEQDLQALQSRVEDALNLLDQQVYIQRTGEEYEFLTDDEKDVEKEIKSTIVDERDLLTMLEEEFFSRIVKYRKIRFDKTKQDFPFTKKVDERISGREQELSIHLVTPFHDQAGNLEILKSHALGKAEVTTVLPADDRLMRDVEMYKKTEKFLRQNQATTRNENIRRIMNDKSSQNENRRREIRNRLAELVGTAHILVSGTELEVPSADPQSRVLRGFEALIQRTYPNLRMLYAVQYDVSQIDTYLQPESTLFNDPAALSEAEREMLNFIQGNQRNGLRTTLKTVLDRFEKKPYGWYLDAVQCLIAKLCTIGKVEAREDSNLLENSILKNALTNTRAFPNVKLTPQTEFSAGQISALRRFYQDFFNTPAGGTDARTLGKETKAAFGTLADDLDRIVWQKETYPFLDALQTPLAAIRLWAGKSYTDFFDELPKEEEQLLDWKESLVDPIRGFLAGEQKTIYDQARAFLRDQKDNLTILYSNPDLEELRQILDNRTPYHGNRMTRAKTLIADLQSLIDERVGDLRRGALAELDDLLSRVQQMADYQNLEDAQQNEVEEAFRIPRQEIETQPVLGLIRDRLRRFREDEYHRILERIARWQVLAEAPVDGPTDGKKVTDRVEYIPVSRIRARFAHPRPHLATEADVEEYLQALKEALLAEIRDGKRISL